MIVDEPRPEQAHLPFEGGRANHPSTFDVRPSPFDVRPSPDIAFIRNNRARRYVLRVQGDGRVRVTLPRWGSKREARAFAESQQAWIEKQQGRLAKIRAAREAAVLALTESERAARDERARETRLRAARELPARLLQLAAELGLAVSRVSVRNQKWRWGSCSPTGHICLNWRLAAVPDWVRDYVLVHELMHLKRMDHSKKFWALVAAACPAYQDARAWLRTHGAGLR